MLMGSAVGHSWGFLPDPSDPPALSFQGLVAERAQGALRLRRASVLHGTNHIGPWRMLNLEEDLYWTQWPWASVCQSSAQPQCTEDGALPDALVSCIELCELFCPADPLALTDIDGDPGGRIPLGLLALTQCPSAGCSAPDKLKLWPFLMPWSPAQSSVSSSAQVGPLTLMRIAWRKTCIGPNGPRPVAISQVPTLVC
ncbi:uncharacterized protein LOC126959063 isoform X12 [Macaca thibetana thibetana]|uniref:uncharacterized protein LOC126959063 isoform X12 n=1 Tax=Macaca thibetana thibetana TaxID=257877 RepID=UPI0021BCC433|nr:uncharacterized protein LOC126959063 isoform X12 [Macaca thibetana thibetana]